LIHIEWGSAEEKQRILILTVDPSEPQEKRNINGNRNTGVGVIAREEEFFLILGEDPGKNEYELVDDRLVMTSRRE
jgi:hypothetical protein